MCRNYTIFDRGRNEGAIFDGFLVDKMIRLQEIVETFDYNLDSYKNGELKETRSRREFRASGKNKSLKIAKDFGPSSRRLKGRILIVFDLSRNAEDGQETSEMGDLFFPSA